MSANNPWLMIEKEAEGTQRQPVTNHCPLSTLLRMIAFLTIELRIEHAQSLKDKRPVVRSLNDLLRAGLLPIQNCYVGVL